MPSTAVVQIPCHDVAGEVDFFVSHGWRVVDVYPADDPRRVRLEGHELNVVVVKGESRGMTIEALGVSRAIDPSPNGTRLVAPPPAFVVRTLVSSPSVSRSAENEAWNVGRAGMHYRDLVPDRQGGAVIASHIRIPTGGPVPDYPHFHEVIFQLIFVHRGWVRLAYESQGEPFVLRAGECVIQPPRIRHRVLESSDDLHVVEVGYPADHITIADHDFDFRSSPVDPSRTWDGQSFVRHTREGELQQRSESGALWSDTGIAAATNGRADVRIVRTSADDSWTIGPVPPKNFVLAFVLDGTIACDDVSNVLEDGDAIVVAVGSSRTFAGRSHGTLLEVRIVTD